MSVQLSQVYMDGESENYYYNAFVSMFTFLNKDNGNENVFRFIACGKEIEKHNNTKELINDDQEHLKCVLADFSATQRKVFLTAILEIYGEETKKINGK